MARVISHAVDGTQTSKGFTKEDLEEEVRQFLANGGKIKRMKEDDGVYDKKLKSTEAKLGGGFNPFSKCDALEEK